jgi:hypothetical protein
MVYPCCRGVRNASRQATGKDLAMVSDWKDGELQAGVAGDEAEAEAEAGEGWYEL